MKHTLYNQTIALAGLAQTVYLIQQIAKHGSANYPAIQSSVHSILKIDADSIEDIYNGLSQLTIGIQQLEKQLIGPPTMDGEQLSYAAMLVYLEKKLRQNPQLLDKIKSGIESISQNNETSGCEISREVITQLADLYQNTVSTLNPRIVINGEQIHLTDRENTDTIRALLLAGIRSAFLWRQCGGNRWEFVLFRKRRVSVAN